MKQRFKGLLAMLLSAVLWLTAMQLPAFADDPSYTISLFDLHGNKTSDTITISEADKQFPTGYLAYDLLCEGSDKARVESGEDIWTAIQNIINSGAAFDASTAKLVPYIYLYSDDKSKKSDVVSFFNMTDDDLKDYIYGSLTDGYVYRLQLEKPSEFPDFFYVKGSEVISTLENKLNAQYESVRIYSAGIYVSDEEISVNDDLNPPELKNPGLPMTVQQVAEAAGSSPSPYYEYSDWNLWSGYSSGEYAFVADQQMTKSDPTGITLTANDVIDCYEVSSTFQRYYPLVQLLSAPVEYKVTETVSGTEYTYTVESHDTFPASAGAGHWVFRYDGNESAVTSGDEVWDQIKALVDSGTAYDATKASLSFVKTISAVELTVTEPANGAAPGNVTCATGNVTLTGSAWSPAVSGAFAADTAYTLTATLTADPGYAFPADVTATVNGNAAKTALSSGELTVTFEFGKTEKNVISSVALTVTEPANGAAPGNVTCATGNVTLTGSAWSPAVSGAFAADTAYTLTATLTADSGYEFPANITATVNGNAAKPALSSGVLTVTFEFGKTAKNDPWSDIRKNPLDGENPVIKVPEGETAIPKDIIEKIKDSGKKTEIKYGEDYSWIIDPDTIDDSKLPDSIDLSIEKIAENDWATVLNNVTGKTYKMQISIKYSGEFGFTAYLKLDLSQAMAGTPAGKYYANLYLLNNGGMDWKAYSEIQNNIALLEFTHASEWAIIVDTEILDGNTVTAAAIEIEAPAYGKAPGTATSTASDSSELAVTWSPAVTEKFAENTAYTAEFKMTLKSGFRFSDSFNATVNGNAAEVTVNGTEAVIKYAFPKTGSSSGNTGGSTGGSSGRYTGSNGKTNEDKIPAKTTKSSGWSEITSEIVASPAGSVIKITLNDDTIITKEALKAASDKGDILEIDAGYGRGWRLKGSDLKTDKDIDLSMSGVDVRIPAESYKDIKSDSAYMVTVNSGDLGFEAELILPLNKNSAGKTAALYRWNGTDLEYAGSAVIDEKGNATFTITKGGKYYAAAGADIPTGTDTPSGTVIPGDVNGDGVVNALDVSALLRFVCFGEAIDQGAADVNSDNTANALDASLILKFCAGMIRNF